MAHQRATGSAPGIQLQIVGAPGWMDSEMYDIQAKADCSSGPIPREQMQLMVQSLLEDRFQFKEHYETRELPIYNLVVVKEGKLKPSEDQTPGPVPAGGPTLCGPVPEFPAPAVAGARGGPFNPNNPPPLPRGAIRMMINPTTGMTLEASSAQIGNIVNLLQNQAGRPVIDKTALKGLFDFKLNFSRDAGRIMQPVLAVIGAKSRDQSPIWGERQELILSWLPNAEPFLLPDAMHLLQVQNPGGMAEGLAAFFARHPL